MENNMLSRRTFGASSALAATLAALPGGVKAAGKKPAAAVNVAPRGDIGKLRRLPTLEYESKIDFLAGMNAWISRDVGKAMAARSAEIIAKSGLGPHQAIPIEQAVALFGKDPVIGMRTALWQSSHNGTVDVSWDAYHSNGEGYLAELEAHDKIGPGSLILNPDLETPEYARHEIHEQLGGYVGDPFAGHIYQTFTNQFYSGHNDQDQNHETYAAETPTPADGNVKRILDMGTGIGQLAMSLKERFPDAEVHGVDVGAPMVRYAHMRAVNLNTEVHFKHALAEETGYPDNHFDVVTAYILFHEVSAEAAVKIIKEAHRILRPGGVFYHLDFNFQRPKTPYSAYYTWFDHHWNNERWELEYRATDFPAVMRNAGFVVDDKSTPNDVLGKIVGTKTA
jgi:ubiquinone/menaquinone biosynthesis C-methylase UbiE